MTRILHLIASTQRRGAELFALRIAEHLDDSIHSNIVLPLKDSGALGFGDASPCLRPAARVSRVPSRSFDAASLFHIFRLIQKEDISVVFAHGSNTLKYASTAKYFNAFRLFYVNIGIASYWSTSRLKRRFYRLLLNKVDNVVSVSNFGRTDFINHFQFPEHKCIYIPNGVDSRRFFPSDRTDIRSRVRKKYGIPANAFSIVSVGSLTDEKNPLAILSILQRLDSIIPTAIPAHVVFVGDGPLRRDIESFSIQMGLGQRVHFSGTIDDIVPELCAADTLVMTSKSEGMPAALIEGSLAELPIVAFDTGGITEVVQNQITGFVSPPGDQTSMAKDLATLASDPHIRKQFGAAGRIRSMNRFDIVSVADRYAELINNS